MDTYGVHEKQLIKTAIIDKSCSIMNSYKVQYININNHDNYYDSSIGERDMPFPREQI